MEMNIEDEIYFTFGIKSVQMLSKFTEVHGLGLRGLWPLDPGWENTLRLGTLHVLTAMVTVEYAYQMRVVCLTSTLWV